MGVREDAFTAATQGLDFMEKRDRFIGAYVTRRANKLHQQKPSATGAELAAHLLKEQQTIKNYIGHKLAELIKGPDPKTPAHLDLTVMANVGNVASHTKTILQSQYVMNRLEWIWNIVWRATMIHDDLLWKTPATALETVALDELLDRRLHAVEQLYCNVNSGGVQLSTNDRQWKVASHKGPWTDGILIRNFEYPVLPKAPFKDHLSKMKNWVDSGNAIRFSPPPDSGQANIRFPDRVSKALTVLIDPVTATRWITFKPNEGLTHAHVFNELFDTPRDNFFDRNWLYCDQTGSSVNVKSLEFGMARRPGGPHTKFETAMTKEGYVRLGPVVRADPREKNEGILMSDDNDEFFENVFIDFNDLQVGDFVCFWNNQLYDLIAAAEWRNEYSHVMDINPSIFGSIMVANTGPQLWLAGHGLTNMLYSAMATTLIGSITGILDSLRNDLTRAVSTNSPPPTTLNRQTLVQWSPYETFDPPGAWWIKIPKDVWNKRWFFASPDDAVKAMPRTVAKETGGTGYNAPPDPEAIYFPLFEPQVERFEVDLDFGGDSWRAYLKKRKADSAFRAPTRLRNLNVDGRLAPGLYYRGANVKVPVVRPKVRK